MDIEKILIALISNLFKILPPITSSLILFCLAVGYYIYKKSQQAGILLMITSFILITAINYHTLHQDMTSINTSLRQDMASMNTSLRQEMASMNTSLRQDMASINTSLRQEMASMNTVMISINTTFNNKLNAIGRIILDQKKFLSSSRQCHEMRIFQIEIFLAIHNSYKPESCSFIQG